MSDSGRSVPPALTSAELLAVLFGTGRGGQTALDIAAGLLELTDGSLRRLAQRPSAELLRLHGIGPTKAGRLLAAFELGARLAREERPPAQRIREPEDVVRLFGGRLRTCRSRSSTSSRWTARARCCARC